MGAYATVILLGNLALMIFWICIAVKALGALRHIGSVLRRIAKAQEELVAHEIRRSR